MPEIRPWIELRTFLHRDGMTQTELAEASGFSTGYISDLLKGRRSPSWRVIARFAEVLKVPKSMLIPYDKKEEEEAA